MKSNLLASIITTGITLQALAQVPDLKNFTRTESDEVLKLALEADDPKMAQNILSSKNFDFFFAKPADIYFQAIQQKKNKFFLGVKKDKKFIEEVTKKIANRLPPQEQNEKLALTTIGEAAEYGNHEIFASALKDYKKNTKNINEGAKMDLTTFAVRSGSVENFTLLKSLGLFKQDPKAPTTYFTHLATKFGTIDFFNLLRKEKLFDAGFSPKGLSWIHQIALNARNDLLNYFVKNKLGNVAEMSKNGLSPIHFAIAGTSSPKSTKDPRFETYNKLVALGLTPFPEIMNEDGSKQSFNQFIEEIDESVSKDVIKINALKGLYLAPDKTTSYLFVIYDGEKNPEYKIIHSEEDMEKLTQKKITEGSEGSFTTKTVDAPLNFPSGLLEITSEGKPLAKKYFLKYQAMNHAELSAFSLPEIDRLPATKSLPITLTFLPETSWGLSAPKKMSALIMKKINFRAKNWPVDAFETISSIELNPRGQEFQTTLNLNNEGSLFVRQKLSSFKDLTEEDKRSVYKAYIDHLNGKPSSSVPWFKSNTATIDVIMKTAGLPDNARLFLPRSSDELQFSLFDSYGEISRKSSGNKEKIQMVTNLNLIEKENPDLIRKESNRDNGFATLDEKKVAQASSISKLKSGTSDSQGSIVKIDSSVSKKILTFMKNKQDEEMKKNAPSGKAAPANSMEDYMYHMLSEVLSDETIYQKVRFFKNSDGKWIFEMDPLL